MGQTTIEWTGKTWNPIKARTKEDMLVPTKSDPFRVIPAGKVGYHCERISQGCCNCYACTMNGRTLPAWGTGLDYTVPNRDKVEIFLDEKVLMEPLRWKRPTKIFPCSMTDWAADFVTDEMMDRMLAVAALTPWHTYQFLTKRADRLATRLKPGRDAGHGFTVWEGAQASTFAAMVAMLPSVDPHALNRASAWQDKYYPEGDGFMRRWPLPNVQLGFSAEDQPNFDARSQHMRKLATAGWFVWWSYEPALGPVNSRDALWVGPEGGWEHSYTRRNWLRWAVAGSESGQGARPCDEQWIRSVKNQCVSADVPFFYKQAAVKGRKIPTPELDGRKWMQFPEVMHGR
jgi:protein gp37